MGLFSLKPARTQAQETEGVQVVADLDALLAKPIGVKIQGRVHLLKPVTAGQFFELYQMAARAEEKAKRLKSEKSFKRDDLLESYQEIFSKVCDTITLELLQSMQNMQIAALFQLVMKSLTGEAHADIQKKNTLNPE